MLLYYANLGWEERQRRKEVGEQRAFQWDICAEGMFEEELPEQKVESMVDSMPERTYFEGPLLPLTLCSSPSILPISRQHIILIFKQG